MYDPYVLDDYQLDPLLDPIRDPLMTTTSMWELSPWAGLGAGSVHFSSAPVESFPCSGLEPNHVIDETLPFESIPDCNFELETFSKVPVIPEPDIELLIPDGIFAEGPEFSTIRESSERIHPSKPELDNLRESEVPLNFLDQEVFGFEEDNGANEMLDLLESSIENTYITANKKRKLPQNEDQDDYQQESRGPMLTGLYRSDKKAEKKPERVFERKYPLKMWKPRPSKGLRGGLGKLRKKYQKDTKKKKNKKPKFRDCPKDIVAILEECKACEYFKDGKCTFESESEENQEDSE
jgi:hypothetical protein